MREAFLDARYDRIGGHGRLPVWRRRSVEQPNIAVLAVSINPFGRGYARDAHVGGDVRDRPSLTSFDQASTSLQRQRCVAVHRCRYQSRRRSFWNQWCAYGSSLKGSTSTNPVVRKNSGAGRHDRVFVMQPAKDRFGTDRIQFSAAMTRLGIRKDEAAGWDIGRVWNIVLIAERQGVLRSSYPDLRCFASSRGDLGPVAVRCGRKFRGEFSETPVDLLAPSA